MLKTVRRSRHYLFLVQEKLSMVFFPLFLAGSNNKVKKNTKIILSVFVLGNFIGALYCIANALNNSLIMENGRYIFHYYIDTYEPNFSFFGNINIRYSHFSYGYLSILMHPSYFSMYLIFSIVIIIDFFRNGLIQKKWFRILSINLVFFFLFMIYLLQSRAGLIMLIVVILIVLIIEIRSKLKKIYFIITISITILFSWAILSTSLIKNNFIEIEGIIANPNEFSLVESEARMQTWYTGINVIKENFWIGTSPANLTECLVLKYKELGFQEAANTRLNSHNQYLETFAGLGIFGFISLLSILIYGFVIAIKKHNYLLFFLLLILSFNFLFESMMNRMSGILFMMFFISLLVFANSTSFNRLDIKKLPEV